MKVLVIAAIILGLIIGGIWGGFWAGLISGVIALMVKSSSQSPEGRLSKEISKPVRPVRPISPPTKPIAFQAAQTPSSAARPAFSISIEMSGGSPAARGRGKPLKWVPTAEPVTVAGRQINSGLIYIAEGSPSVLEPSAINLRLPVAEAASGVDAQLPYFPCYDYLTPQQRGTYLDWLANGRLDAAPESREFGYIFLFFYGLERRVLVDGDFSDEIANEVARLIVTYSPHGRSKSLPTYLSQLLHFWGFHQGPERYAQLWPWILDISSSVLDKDELQLVLGSLAAQGASAPARVAREIAYHEPNAVRSNVTTRSPVEFQALFDERFSKTFPNGLPLRLGQRPALARYLPASASLRYDAQNGTGRFVARTTYVSIDSGERQKLVELWNECCSDLSGYVRAKAKSVGKAVDLPTLISTPPELRARQSSELKQKLDELLEAAAVDGEFRFLAAGTIGAFFGLESREKYTLTQSKQLADGLACLDLMIEPDPRTHGAALPADHEVALFAASPELPSNSFLGRCALVQMAASVAASDGGLDLRESETISLMIESEVLPDAERIRLRAWSALLARNLDNAPATIVKVAKAVPAANSQAVAQLLCRVATADGIVTKNEERMLQRIFRALSLAPDIVATLKKELEGFDEVSVSQATPAAQGEPIPAPEIGTAARFALDRDRIKALSAETAEVIGILSVAMADAEHEHEASAPAAAKPVAASDTTEVELAWAEGLDAKFVPLLARLVERESWARRDFDAITSELHLMSGAAYDAINEWSDEALGDFLLQDDDPIFVNRELIPAEKIQH